MALASTNANSTNLTLYDEFAALARDEAHQLTLKFLANCRSREIRDILQFAKDEIILPMDGGPFQGQPFDESNQPYVVLLWLEIMSGLWSEVIVCGPSQSGKTLSAFVIPIIYILFELRKNVVVGVPDEKMINDKWMADLLPVLTASYRLAQMIPTSGPGSKGGTVKEFVKFTTGVIMKFMTRGGSDQSKAGFTASHVVVTEAAGWSRGTQTSKEADPLRQLRARQKATRRFDEDFKVNRDRLMIIEGTVTDEEDLPLRDRPHSSDSRLVCPCVHCGEYVSPEREHFGGWEAAKTELEAAKIGRFCCPRCGETYSDAQRREMNSRCRLLHKGQSIDKDGTIHGDIPETTTLFFRWSAFNNLFLGQADLAADEWKAAQLDESSAERDEAEKELCQTVWALPYKPRAVEHEPLKASDVRRRLAPQLPSGILPENSSIVSWGVDVGKWVCWYFVLVTRADGTLHSPLYGSMDTGLASENSQSNVHQHIAIKACLNRIIDLAIKGLGLETGGIRSMDGMLIDSGYHPDAVAEVVRERNIKDLYASLGRGRSQLDARKYDGPTKTGAIVRKIGHRWHKEYDSSRRQFRIVFDADDSKLSIQACLRVTPGNPGALTLAETSQRDHTMVARHLASEVYRRWIEPGKGLQEKWLKSGTNHLLDCGGMALVMQRVLGWKLPSGIEVAIPVERPAAASIIAESSPPETAMKFRHSFWGRGGN